MCQKIFKNGIEREPESSAIFDKVMVNTTQNAENKANSFASGRDVTQSSTTRTAETENNEAEPLPGRFLRARRSRQQITETSTSSSNQKDATATPVVQCKLPLDRINDILSKIKKTETSDVIEKSDNVRSDLSVQPDLNSFLPNPVNSDSINNMGESTTDANNLKAAPIRLLCLFCDRTFISTILLQKHTDRSHRVSSNRRVSTRIVEQAPSEKFHPNCNLCSKSNSIQTSTNLLVLFHHLLDEHASRYFGCRDCKVRFLNKDTLSSHNVEIHGDVPGAANDSKLDSSDKSTQDDDSSPKSSHSSLPSIDIKDKLNISEVVFNNDEPHNGRIRRKRRGSKRKISIKPKACGNLIHQKDLHAKFLRQNSIKEFGLMEKSRKNDDTEDDAKKSDVVRKISIEQNAVIVLDDINIDNKLFKNNKNVSTPQLTKQDDKTMLYRLGIAQNRSNRTRNLRRSRKTPVTDNRACSETPRKDKSKTKGECHDFVINKNKNDPSCKFDPDFYATVSANVRENLTMHLDGKLGQQETCIIPELIDPKIKSTHAVIESPITQPTEIHGSDVNLNAITVFPTLLTSDQYGSEKVPHYSYGATAFKKIITKNSWKWKWDPIKKYKYCNEDGKIVRKIRQVQHTSPRDLSKLDIWTQLTMREKHDNSTLSEDFVDRTSRNERQKQINELNTILDRRSFPNIEKENLRNSQITDADADEDVKPLITESAELKPDDRDLSMLNNLGLVQRAPQPPPPPSTVLSGEWARPRCYICCICGRRADCLKLLEAHQSSHHPHVNGTYYEIVGQELLENEVHKYLYLPGSKIARDRIQKGAKDDLGLRKIKKVAHHSVRNGRSTRNFRAMTRSITSMEKGCTKCNKMLSPNEFYRHILECAGDYGWIMAKKKCKYKPFGARRRRLKGLYKREVPQEEERPENKNVSRPKLPPRPRTKPSDAETIERMLANLPPKRSSRQANASSPQKVKNDPQTDKNPKRIIRRLQSNVSNVVQRKKILNGTVIASMKCGKRIRRITRSVSSKRVEEEEEEEEQEEEKEKEVVETEESEKTESNLTEIKSILTSPADLAEQFFESCAKKNILASIHKDKIGYKKNVYKEDGEVSSLESSDDDRIPVNLNESNVSESREDSVTSTAEETTDPPSDALKPTDNSEQIREINDDSSNTNESEGFLRRTRSLTRTSGPKHVSCKIIKNIKKFVKKKSANLNETNINNKSVSSQTEVNLEATNIAKVKNNTKSKKTKKRSREFQPKWIGNKRIHSNRSKNHLKNSNSHLKEKSDPPLNDDGDSKQADSNAVEIDAAQDSDEVKDKNTDTNTNLSEESSKENIVNSTDMYPQKMNLNSIFQTPSEEKLLQNEYRLLLSNADIPVTTYSHSNVPYGSGYSNMNNNMSNNNFNCNSQRNSPYKSNDMMNVIQRNMAMSDANYQRMLLSQMRGYDLINVEEDNRVIEPIRSLDNPYYTKTDNIDKPPLYIESRHNPALFVNPYENVFPGKSSVQNDYNLFLNAEDSKETYYEKTKEIKHRRGKKVAKNSYEVVNYPGMAAAGSLNEAAGVDLDVDNAVGLADEGAAEAASNAEEIIDPGNASDAVVGEAVDAAEGGDGAEGADANGARNPMRIRNSKLRRRLNDCIEMLRGKLNERENNFPEVPVPPPPIDYSNNIPKANVYHDPNELMQPLDLSGKIPQPEDLSMKSASYSAGPSTSSTPIKAKPVEVVEKPNHSHILNIPQYPPNQNHVSPPVSNATPAPVFPQIPTTPRKTKCDFSIPSLLSTDKNVSGKLATDYEQHNATDYSSLKSFPKSSTTVEAPSVAKEVQIVPTEAYKFPQTTAVEKPTKPESKAGKHFIDDILYSDKRSEKSKSPHESQDALITTTPINPKIEIKTPTPPIKAPTPPVETKSKTAIECPPEFCNVNTDLFLIDPVTGMIIERTEAEPEQPAPKIVQSKVERKSAGKSRKEQVVDSDKAAGVRSTRVKSDKTKPDSTEPPQVVVEAEAAVVEKPPENKLGARKKEPTTTNFIKTDSTESTRKSKHKTKEFDDANNYDQKLQLFYNSSNAPFDEAQKSIQDPLNKPKIGKFKEVSEDHDMIGNIKVSSYKSKLIQEKIIGECSDKVIINESEFALTPTNSHELKTNDTINREKLIILPKTDAEIKDDSSTLNEITKKSKTNTTIKETEDNKALSHLDNESGDVTAAITPGELDQLTEKCLAMNVKLNNEFVKTNLKLNNATIIGNEESDDDITLADMVKKKTENIKLTLHNDVKPPVKNTNIDAEHERNLEQNRPQMNIGDVFDPHFKPLNRESEPRTSEQPAETASTAAETPSTAAETHEQPEIPSTATPKKKSKGKASMKGKSKPEEPVKTPQSEPSPEKSTPKSKNKGTAKHGNTRKSNRLSSHRIDYDEDKITPINSVKLSENGHLIFKKQQNDESTSKASTSSSPSTSSSSSVPTPVSEPTPSPAPAQAVADSTDSTPEKPEDSTESTSDVLAPNPPYNEEHQRKLMEKVMIAAEFVERALEKVLDEHSNKKRKIETMEAPTSFVKVLSSRKKMDKSATTGDRAPVLLGVGEETIVVKRGPELVDRETMTQPNDILPNKEVKTDVITTNDRIDTPVSDPERVKSKKSKKKKTPKNDKPIAEAVEEPVAVIEPQPKSVDTPPQIPAPPLNSTLDSSSDNIEENIPLNKIGEFYKKSKTEDEKDQLVEPEFKDDLEKEQLNAKITFKTKPRKRSYHRKSQQTEEEEEEEEEEETSTSEASTPSKGSLQVLGPRKLDYSGQVSILLTSSDVPKPKWERKCKRDKDKFVDLMEASEVNVILKKKRKIIRKFKKCSSRGANVRMIRSTLKTLKDQEDALPNAEDTDAESAPIEKFDIETDKPLPEPLNVTKEDELPVEVSVEPLPEEKIEKHDEGSLITKIDLKHIKSHKKKKSEKKELRNLPEDQSFDHPKEAITADISPVVMLTDQSDTPATFEDKLYETSTAVEVRSKKKSKKKKSNDLDVNSSKIEVADMPNAINNNVSGNVTQKKHKKKNEPSVDDNLESSFNDYNQTANEIMVESAPVIEIKKKTKKKSKNKTNKDTGGSWMLSDNSDRVDLSSKNESKPEEEATVMVLKRTNDSLNAAYPVFDSIITRKDPNRSKTDSESSPVEFSDSKAPNNETIEKIVICKTDDKKRSRKKHSLNELESSFELINKEEPKQFKKCFLKPEEIESEFIKKVNALDVIVKEKSLFKEAQLDYTSDNRENIYEFNLSSSLEESDDGRYTKTKKTKKGKKRNSESSKYEIVKTKSSDSSDKLEPSTVISLKIKEAPIPCTKIELKKPVDEISVPETQFNVEAKKDEDAFDKLIDEEPESPNVSFEKEKKKKMLKAKIQQAAVVDSVEIKPADEAMDETEIDKESRIQDKYLADFGMYTEKRPRKSTILAIKKISQTFKPDSSDTDETADKSNPSRISLKPQKKRSKKFHEEFPSKIDSIPMSPQSEQVDIIPVLPIEAEVEPPPTEPEPIAETSPPPKLKLPRSETYCAICKRKFRRPENLLKHKTTLTHISKLSEMEASENKKKSKKLSVKDMDLDQPDSAEEVTDKDKSFALAQQPRSYKNLAERKSFDNESSQTSTAAVCSEAIPETTSFDEMDSNVEDIAVKTFIEAPTTEIETEMAGKKLSRDEALFFECCSLLKESEPTRKPELFTAPEKIIEPKDDTKNVVTYNLSMKNIIQATEIIQPPYESENADYMKIDYNPAQSEKSQDFLQTAEFNSATPTSNFEADKKSAVVPEITNFFKAKKNVYKDKSALKLDASVSDDDLTRSVDLLTSVAKDDADDTELIAFGSESIIVRTNSNDFSDNNDSIISSKEANNVAKALKSLESKSSRIDKKSGVKHRKKKSHYESNLSLDTSEDEVEKIAEPDLPTIDEPIVESKKEDALPPTTKKFNFVSDLPSQFIEFEDKFDKIKRKAREKAQAAQEALAAATSPAVHTKIRKKYHSKPKKTIKAGQEPAGKSMSKLSAKGRRISKKKINKELHKSNSKKILTKGALKGFDSVKMPTPPSNINPNVADNTKSNLQELVEYALQDENVVLSEASSSNQNDAHGYAKKNFHRKQEKRSSKKSSKRLSYTSNYQNADNSSAPDFDDQQNLDIYEFFDDDDDNVTEKNSFEFSSISNNFAEKYSFSSKRTSGDQCATSSADKNAVEPLNEESQISSLSFSDRDDFNFMSDDYNENRSDDETNASSNSDNAAYVAKFMKKNKSLKNRKVTKKSAIMGRIFKNNAIRNDQKPPSETSNDINLKEVSYCNRTNMDQIFDSLLEKSSSSNVKMSSKNSEKLTYDHSEVTDYGSTQEDTNCAQPDNSHKIIDSASDFDSDDMEDKLILPPRSNQRKIIPRLKARFSDDENSANPSVSKDTSEDIMYGKRDKYQDSIGVANRKSQRKCTTGKQNILVESWSSESDYEDFRQFEEYSSIPKTQRHHRRPRRSRRHHSSTDHKSVENSDEKPNSSVTHYDNPYDNFASPNLNFQNKLMYDKIDDDDYSNASKDYKNMEETSSHKKSSEEENFEGTSQQQSKIKRKVTFNNSNSKSRRRKKQTPKPFDYDDEFKPTRIAEPLIAQRRNKRSASEMLYYWSSSSDDELFNVAVDTSSREPEPVEQHGWIVGDSHKKLVTMLAHAKGRKLDDTATVKEKKSRLQN